MSLLLSYIINLYLLIYLSNIYQSICSLFRQKQLSLIHPCQPSSTFQMTRNVISMSFLPNFIIYLYVLIYLLNIHLSIYMFRQRQHSLIHPCQPSSTFQMIRNVISMSLFAFFYYISLSIHLSVKYSTINLYIQAETAFFDPSLLALLYSPDDQKYAIYVPFAFFYYISLSIHLLVEYVSIILYFLSMSLLLSFIIYLYLFIYLLNIHLSIYMFRQKQHSLIHPCQPYSTFQMIKSMPSMCPILFQWVCLSYSL